jgi:hypothetical protein
VGDVGIIGERIIACCCDDCRVSQSFSHSITTLLMHDLVRCRRCEDWGNMIHERLSRFSNRSFWKMPMSSLLVVVLLFCFAPLYLDRSCHFPVTETSSARQDFSCLSVLLLQQGQSVTNTGSVSVNEVPGQCRLVVNSHRAESEVGLVEKVGDWKNLAGVESGVGFDVTSLSIDL